MAKVVNKKCGAPTLKQLPEEFSEQVSIDVDRSSVLTELLKASLPQLAKRVNADNYYSANAIKAVNLASSLHEKLEDVGENWNRYRNTELTTELCKRGISTDWQIMHDNGQTENMHVSELYDDTEIELHVVVKRRRKSKEWLAGKGVK